MVTLKALSIAEVAHKAGSVSQMNPHKQQHGSGVKVQEFFACVDFSVESRGMGTQPGTTTGKPRSFLLPNVWKEGPPSARRSVAPQT